MKKTLKQILGEVSSKPRSAEEQRFVDQHEVEVIQHPVAPESQFKGTIDKLARFADNTNGSDKTSYDKAYASKDQEKVMKESTYEDTEMLLRQMHFICYAAEEIIEYLEDGGAAAPWYQNKIAVIFDKMQTLHAYAEGEKHMEDDEAEIDFSTMQYEDLQENTFKTGTLTLDNKDKVKLSSQDAKLLNDLLKDLDNKNRKNFQDILMTDKSGFDEILGFAREAL